MPDTFRVKLLQDHRIDGILYPKGHEMHLPRKDALRLAHLGVVKIAGTERAVFEAPEKR